MVASILESQLRADSIFYPEQHHYEVTGNEHEKLWVLAMYIRHPEIYETLDDIFFLVQVRNFYLPFWV